MKTGTMRRLAAVLLPVLIALLAGITFVILEVHPGLPRPAERVLETYLSGRSQRTGVTATVVDAVPAARPHALEQAVRGSAYGESAYYRTVDTIPPTGEPLTVVVDSRRPIPEPPQALWCILLETAPGGAPDVVFVALHQDLYNAGWLVHERRTYSGALILSDLMDLVGCSDLALEERTG
jgi:hypothetical protein